MCIVIHCQFCKDIIPSADLRRTTCDKPECRDALTKLHAKYKRGELRCKVCNEIIPVGSKRRYYCTDECRKEVLRRRGRDNMRKRKMKMEMEK